MLREWATDAMLGGWLATAAVVGMMLTLLVMSRRRTGRCVGMTATGVCGRRHTHGGPCR